MDTQTDRRTDGPDWEAQSVFRPGIAGVPFDFGFSSWLIRVLYCTLEDSSLVCACEHRRFPQMSVSHNPRGLPPRDPPRTRPARHSPLAACCEVPISCRDAGFVTRELPDKGSAPVAIIPSPAAGTVRVRETPRRLAFPVVVVQPVFSGRVRAVSAPAASS
jgi:hypothetical protein